MKRLLIIGGGEFQIPLIKSASKNGIFTIVCDGNINCSGARIADEFCNISTKDSKSLCKLASMMNIDGVVANSEYAMCDVAQIATDLGLPGNLRSSIELLSSKICFRKLQKMAGVFSPHSCEVGLLSEAIDVIENFSLPVIIKPSQSSGSRGTAIISDKNDKKAIRSAFDSCACFSRNHLVTVEEYVSMISDTVIEGEIFINNGEFLWDGLFTTFRCPFNRLIPMTYVFPAILSDCERRNVKNTLKKLFVTAGIKHGEYNVELYFYNGKVFVIEINARQGGNGLPYYVYRHCGIDMYRLLVTTAVGDNSYWEKIRKYERTTNLIAHHVLYPEKSGVFIGVEIDNSIEQFVKNKKIKVTPGELIKATEDGSSEIGFIDFEFDTIETQAQICKVLSDRVVIKTE